MWQLTATFSQVAAQNCRKRKIDQIKQLETEVTHKISSYAIIVNKCYEKKNKISSSSILVQAIAQN